MSKNEKVPINVTIDVSVLEIIDEQRGELIPRSRYVDYLLKKALTTLRKEQEDIIVDKKV